MTFISVEPLGWLLALDGAAVVAFSIVKDREFVGEAQKWGSFLYHFKTGNVARDNVADL